MHANIQASIAVSPEIQQNKLPNLFVHVQLWVKSNVLRIIIELIENARVMSKAYDYLLLLLCSCMHIVAKAIRLTRYLRKKVTCLPTELGYTEQEDAGYPVKYIICI